MTALDEALYRRWTHSHEEDHDEVLVYRPADHDFPPARGRDGLEFRRDGGFVTWAIGRGDAREPRPGSWRPVAGNRIRISPDAGAPRVLEVVRVAPDRLELRVGEGL